MTKPGPDPAPRAEPAGRRPQPSPDPAPPPVAAGRRPRLADVAARAGVSPGLASLVLRNQPGPSKPARARVLGAARELGYRPDRTASLLARRRSHHLGVTMDVRNTFHAELVADIDAAATRLGYDLVLGAATPTRDQHRAAEILLDFRCEALILLGPEDQADWLGALGHELPVVVIGRRMDPAGVGVDVVRASDDQGVAQAVSHLTSLGHRDIAFVDGGQGAIASDRRQGYRQAMRRHGLAARVIPGDHTEEAGIRAAREMLSTDTAPTADRAPTAGGPLTAAGLPTAVITSNDRCAVGLLDAFVRRGVQVPGTVSVVGYDDSMLARLAHVDLTTVSQDAGQQAARAVDLAVERLESGRTAPREVVLTPRLVVRGTTAPPRPAPRLPPAPQV
jgi:DNA-binding LacI/PurR family transcriptional regulator